MIEFGVAQFEVPTHAKLILCVRSVLHRQVEEGLCEQAETPRLGPSQGGGQGRGDAGCRGASSCGYVECITFMCIAL